MILIAKAFNMEKVIAVAFFKYCMCIDVHQCRNWRPLSTGALRYWQLWHCPWSSVDTAPAPPCRAIIIPSLIEKTPNSKLIVIMNLPTRLFHASELTFICNSLQLNEEDSVVGNIFKTCWRPKKANQIMAWIPFLWRKMSLKTISIISKECQSINWLQCIISPPITCTKP